MPAGAGAPTYRSDVGATSKVVDLGKSIKGELLDLLQAVGRQKGLGRAALDHLIWLIRRTRSADWLPGNRAVVYLPVRETAAILGIDRRQVNRLEEEIAAAFGAYVPEPGCRRHGRRDEAGRIVVANGLELTPLRDALPALRRVKAELDDYHARRRQRRDELAAARGRVRRLAVTVEEIGDTAHIEAARAIAASARARVSEADAKSVEALERCILAATDACHALERLLLAGKTCGSQVDTSDTSDKNVPHIQSLTDSHTHRTVGCSPAGDAAARKPAGSVRAPRTARLSGREHPTRPELQGPAYLPPEATGAYQITPAAALTAASGRFRSHLPTDCRKPTVDDIEDAAGSLLAEIDLGRWAWRQACEVMGTYPAALSLLIADRRAADGEVASVGGYFVAMLRRAERGRLHIHRSIYGLSSPSKYGDK